MKKYLMFAAALALGSTTYAGLSTFDSKDTGPNNYYRPATHGGHDWSDAGANFNMQVFTNEWGSSWAGFTYSDVNDTATSGFNNQYAVYGDGLDYSDTGVYSIGYIDGFNGVSPSISFGSAQTVNGFYANNTTYAALDMINGSGFSKAFSTNDWFELTIEGFNGSAQSQGTVDFRLADFAGYVEGDNKEDYMVTDWAWVDLTSLGSDVNSLVFSLSSSDIGTFGMNTPSYFAVDNIDAIPEPGTIMLVLFGFAGMAGFRKRLKR